MVGARLADRGLRECGIEMGLSLRLKYIRWSVQFGSFYVTFPLLLPVFYCPYRLPWIMCTVCAVYWCPLKYMRDQITYFISGLTLTTGRGFCGWFCPYGSLQDLFNKFGRKFSGTGDLVVKDYPRLRYVTLGLTLVVILHMLGWINIPLLDVIIPGVPRWIPYVLGFFLLASVFVARLWCRFICPLGGAMSLFNKVSLLSLTLRHEKSGMQSLFKNPCIYASDEKKYRAGTADCIVCGECI